MAKRMSDDEIMDYTYNKLFGDLDNIESGSMFSDKKDATQGASDNAGTPGMEGIELTIKPLMAAAAESGRPPEGGEPEGENEDDEEDDDKLKGIGRMSPLMSQLHGSR
jgi:hypothetical protein